ncbi:MAG: Nif11-like leader peptide family natural product precursor [Blautia sp.]|nr:Nif11-like leader peptide family natural product precursor [Blautia sp.]MCM1200140.1 Nif11-like leader peptide family natural product precursor [Bacteroides fragilis]
MSLKEFKEKVTKDEEYAKKFAGIGEVEQIVTMAGQDGYNFTAEDFRKDTDFSQTEAGQDVNGWIIYKGFINW